MKNIKTRDLIYCALFAALTAIGAFLHFQLFQATITLQFFFTAMAGLLLGAKLGALSQLLYVALGLVGVPIFAAGGGFGYIFNPTFGFLLPKRTVPCRGFCLRVLQALRCCTSWAFPISR